VYLVYELTINNYASTRNKVGDILTAFRLELELRLYSVVTTVQQTTVDGERSQFRIQFQLSRVILSVTLHNTETGSS